MANLIYFADPMCSWCYGFATVINELMQSRADLTIEPVMGGLRTGSSHILDDAMKVRTRQHWQHVAKASNQPFDFSFFDRTGFIYDTEPACRAVVLMRKDCTRQALHYFHRIQSAFYARNIDITQETELVALADGLVDDLEVFRAALSSKQSYDLTQADFALTQKLKIGGFPTLVLKNASSLHELSSGFLPFSALVTRLEALLNSTGPQVAADQ